MTGTPEPAIPGSAWVPVLPGKQLFFDLGQGPRVGVQGNLVVRCHELQGELDVARLTECLARLQSTHDSLRLRFAEHDGVGFMRALDMPREPALQRLQLSGWTEENLPRYIRRLSGAVARDWTSVEAGSARWALLRLEPSRHVLISWYEHLSVDARSLTMLERQLWAAYHGDESAIRTSSSFIDCARRRSRGARRCVRDFWATELDRLSPQVTAPDELTVMQNVSRTVPAEKVHSLRSADHTGKLSAAQLIAHRFAVVASQLAGGEPFVVYHFVDERGLRENDVCGAFSSIVPVVYTDRELVTPAASARKTLRALAERPRRSGTALPKEFVMLQTAVTTFTYMYLPAHFGDAVRPRSNLEVTELEIGRGLRDPHRMRIRVAERLEGGLEFTMSYHPEEHSEGDANRLLDAMTVGVEGP